jgi:hypothetical protein
VKFSLPKGNKGCFLEVCSKMYGGEVGLVRDKLQAVTCSWLSGPQFDSVASIVSSSSNL